MRTHALRFLKRRIGFVIARQHAGTIAIVSLSLNQPKDWTS